MENIGAGLAALGVIGPGIGIGILTGMSTSAIGRNPDAAAQIRGNVHHPRGVRRRPRRPRDRRRPARDLPRAAGARRSEQTDHRGPPGRSPARPPGRASSLSAEGGAEAA